MSPFTLLEPSNMSEAMMSWTNYSVNNDVRQTAGLVDDVVQDYQSRGYRRLHAMEQAALALCITPRRVKGLIFGEVFRLAPGEYQFIRRRYLDHLDERADSLNARFEAVKAKRRQMEMDL